MRSYLVLILFTLGSCSSKENSVNNARSKASNKRRTGSTPNELMLMQDSTERIRFWEQAIIPMLKKDKETVLNNIEFPLLYGPSNCANREDFRKIYDRIFCDKFLDIIGKEGKPYIRAQTFSDAIGIGYHVPAQDSEGDDIGLIFIKYDTVYKFKGVISSGGEFCDSN
jgi:hypothetical protein